MDQNTRRHFLINSLLHENSEYADVKVPDDEQGQKQLASCYRECLKLADENEVGSIAFCCISTGVFHFPNDEAARIAVDTVKQYRNETGSKIEVIFNGWKDIDNRIYHELLG